jgi:threonine dehydrogenase-like Zn-dependent dehydrogenase
MECFYCRNAETSRCEKSQLFGCPTLDGAQAEYVRVPLADGTLVLAPQEIPQEILVIMGDIVGPPASGPKAAGWC